MTTHVDLETRSALDLKKCGVHRYAEDPSTEIILAAGQGSGLPLMSHNAQFERVMLNANGGSVRPEDQVCTMARAAALSLPMSLDKCCEALAAPVQKDQAGYRLMLKMCKAGYQPRPGELERLQAYCDQDVEAEMALDKLLPPLSASEQRLWVLDQKINDRGFAIDVPLVEAAHAAVLEAKKRADRKMWELTGGEVSKCTETARIVRWLRGRGIPCDSIAEGEVDELLIKASLFDDGAARAVVELRAASARAFKFQSMLDCVCRDGRIRGTLAYHGALSGRWTGRLVQPQNFKRVETEDDERLVATTVKARGRGADLHTLSLIARACIVAPPGKKLVGGDFSNIEGRINAWLAGEKWKVEAFARGDPMYETMAARILNKPVTAVAKEDRQIWGKVPELACLGPDTLVITDRGLVPIEEVRATDKLWDGVEWVLHGGLVDRGPKAMIELNGLELTPDHPVLLGETWFEAQTVASDPHWSRLASANASGSLRSPAFLSGLQRVSDSLWCAVPALRMNTELTPAILGQVDRLAATVVQNAKRGIGGRTTGVTRTLSPMTHIDAGCLTAYRHVLIGATTLVTPGIPTTGFAEYRCLRLGEAIDELSSYTSQVWADGMTQALSLIGKTWPEDTNQETSDSLRARRTARTLERSASYSGGSTSWRGAFDIAHAGPRNRFMVWGIDGPLIVHNCGYQGGVNAFNRMGANYGVSVDSALAKRVVTEWRSENPAIVDSWRELQEAGIEATSAKGVEVSALRGRVAYRHAKGFLWCRLPSGRVLAYPGAVVERKSRVVVIDGEEVEFNNWGVSFWHGTPFRKVDLYGGMQCAHVVSGTARDILAGAMHRIEAAGYPIVLTVHDEALSEVDQGFGSAAHYQQIMEAREPWFDGLPLAAKAWEDVRYTK